MLRLRSRPRLLLRQREPNVEKQDKTEKKGAQASAPSKLVKTGRKGAVELREEELARVAGGCAEGKHYG